MPIITPGGGGAAFNGGTITSPLEVDPASGAPSVVVSGVPGDPDNTVIFRIQDDPTNTDNTFDVEHDGTLHQFDANLNSPAAGAFIAVTAGNGGRDIAQWGTYSAQNQLTLSNGGQLLINPGGTIGLNLRGPHAAPADGDLLAGDCALWFDQTNGAAKLMVKAKQANGTVVTGSVNLA